MDYLSQVLNHSSGKIVDDGALWLTLIALGLIGMVLYFGVRATVALGRMVLRAIPLGVLVGNAMILAGAPGVIYGINTLMRSADLSKPDPNFKCYTYSRAVAAIKDGTPPALVKRVVDLAEESAQMADEQYHMAMEDWKAAHQRPSPYIIIPLSICIASMGGCLISRFNK